MYWRDLVVELCGVTGPRNELKHLGLKILNEEAVFRL
jgi:hypothetical protein